MSKEIVLGYIVQHKDTGLFHSRKYDYRDGQAEQTANLSRAKIFYSIKGAKSSYYGMETTNLNFIPINVEVI